ncbi:MAG: methyltransferase domain-containing protein [Methanobacteriaceae archaeon]|nr:methyltransferase domain-containing protein [Methanobacteriaceae archaeon]
MAYHDNLIKDKKRVEAFYKAISEKSHGITYDLGTGSGILAKQAIKTSNKVYAIEISPKTIQKAKETLKNISNVIIEKQDAKTYNFPEAPDTIICEMLDTALIDEEQVPVINNTHKYKKETTIYIPEETITIIQLIKTNIVDITYFEDNKPEYIPLSKEKILDVTVFKEHINPKINKVIKLTTDEDNIVNAIKLTTYTKLTKEIILKPTPMLNPPLFIPLNKKIRTTKGKEILINISYSMGGGLNTIQTDIK